MMRPISNIISTRLVVSKLLICYYVGILIWWYFESCEYELTIMIKVHCFFPHFSAHFLLPLDSQDVWWISATWPPARPTRPRPQAPSGTHNHSTVKQWVYGEIGRYNIPWYTLIYHDMPWYDDIPWSTMISWYNVIVYNFPWYIIHYHPLPST